MSEVTVLIPNRTILVRFGGESGEFGRAMVRILARRSQFFRVSFSESWKSKLREKFGSILKQKSFSAVRKCTHERPPV